MQNEGTPNDLGEHCPTRQKTFCIPRCRAVAAVRRLYTLGPDAITRALLAAARRIAEQDARLTLLEAQARTSVGVSPSTPSGQRPLHTNPNVAAGRAQRRKRPGAKDGHPGHHRPVPTRIDERREHRLKVCPCCSG